MNAKLPEVYGFSEEKVKELLGEEAEKYAVEAEPSEPAGNGPEATEESEPAPAPPQEGVTDEADDGRPIPKAIPYERFAEAQRKAREREAEYARQLDELRKQQAQLLAEQQAFLRKQMEAQAPAPEPVEEDPLKVLIRTEAEEMVRPLRQHMMAQQQMAALQERIAKAEAEVEKAFPDYKAVTAPVQAKMAEAAMAAQKGNPDAARWLQSILMDENPPLKAYMIGRWESARAQGTPQQPTEMQQASSAPQPQRGNTPPALPRGTQVQGSNTPDAIADISRVASMSVEEYAAWRQKNPALARKFLRGEF